MINLSSPLSIKNSFLFPLQTKVSRREIMIGGLWLLVPFYGWILNVGHRIQMVHNMQHGKETWPSWDNYSLLFKNGFITFLGMLFYHLPSILIEYYAFSTNNMALHITAAVLWLLATKAVPGFMSHYCLNFDSSEIFNPLKAFKRIIEGGKDYWKAWSIALSALILSFSGILLFGIGFLFTSVWFWQVAGFSFATVFSQKYRLKNVKYYSPV